MGHRDYAERSKVLCSNVYIATPGQLLSLLLATMTTTTTTTTAAAMAILRRSVDSLLERL
jgi:hypothetical protein